MILPENQIILNEWIENTTDSIETISITDPIGDNFMKQLFEEYYELRIRITPLDYLIKEKQNI